MSEDVTDADLYENIDMDHARYDAEKVKKLENEINEQYEEMAELVQEMYENHTRLAKVFKNLSSKMEDLKTLLEMPDF